MKKKLKCILLVDDDEPTNFINEMTIKLTDCTEHVQTCQTAMEALDLLSQEVGFTSSWTCSPKPDIIFLDINLPGLNGWDFLDEYGGLQIEGKEDVIIVMLTNSFNPDDENRAATTREVTEYMNKPLTTKKIYDLLKKYFPESHES